MTLSEREVRRLRAQVAKPVWNVFECARCTRLFRVQGFADTCHACTAAAEKHGVPPILGGFSGC